eukprot:3296830-Pyramimonas_sp.AAC.3
MLAGNLARPSSPTWRCRRSIAAGRMFGDCRPNGRRWRGPRNWWAQSRARVVREPEARGPGRREWDPRLRRGGWGWVGYGDRGPLKAEESVRRVPGAVAKRAA